MLLLTRISLVKRKKFQITSDNLSGLQEDFSHNKDGNFEINKVIPSHPPAWYRNNKFRGHFGLMSYEAIKNKCFTKGEINDFLLERAYKFKKITSFLLYGFFIHFNLLINIL